MGKSSLAYSLLHLPKVVQTFGHCRFAVACESLTGLEELLFAIMSQLGPCAPSGVHGIGLVQDKLLWDIRATHKKTLIVLDNFGEEISFFIDRAFNRHRLSNRKNLGAFLLPGGC